MATTRCVCGEQIHYSADNVGFNARCRCGRTVLLPKIPYEPPPKTPQQLADEEERSLRVRRQILAVGLFLIVTIGLVLGVALVNQPGGSGSTPSRQPRPAAAEQP